MSFISLANMESSFYYKPWRHGETIIREAYDFESDSPACGSLDGLVNLGEGPFIEGFDNVKVVDRREKPLLLLSWRRMQFMMQLGRGRQGMLLRLLEGSSG